VTHITNGHAELRADAARNRARILRAARELIGSRGRDIGMNEIARSAGVAVGTLYRHFPAKADLVAAIFEEAAGRLAADLDAALARTGDGGSAGAEIAALFEQLAESAETDRALKAAAAQLGQAGPLRAIQEQATTALTCLVAAAQAQGELYDDVTGDDLAILLTALTSEDIPRASRRRLLRLTLRSLFRPDHQPPGPWS
jgi:AcrR family transcriptional regulator